MLKSKIILAVAAATLLLSVAPAPACNGLTVVDANGALVGVFVAERLGAVCPLESSHALIGPWRCTLGSEPVLVARHEGGKLEAYAVNGDGFAGRGVPGLVPPFRFVFEPPAAGVE